MSQPNKHDSQMADSAGNPLIAKTQGAAVTVPTDLATSITAITAIIERLEAHGFIADN